MAIAVGPDGSVYAADSEGRIEKFSADGEFVRQWGSRGSGDGQFQTPTGIAVSRSGHIYVCEFHGNRIQVLDADGHFLRKWGSQGNREGQFNGPEKIALDQEGNVYVTDTGNCRIEKFAANGNFRKAWGRPGSAPGEFKLPVGIAVSSNGRVYVADLGLGGVQVFSTNGKYLTRYSPGLAAVPEPTLIWSRKKAKGGDLSFGMGEVPAITPELARSLCDSSLVKPAGIAVDASGAFYVTNGACDRVQKYRHDGRFLGGWYVDGRPTHFMERMSDLALGRDGDVYVVEMNGPTVRRFGYGPVRADRMLAESLGSGYLSMLDSILALPFGEQVAKAPVTRTGRLTLKWSYLGFNREPALVGAEAMVNLLESTHAGTLPGALAGAVGGRLGYPHRPVDSERTAPDSAHYENAGILLQATISRRPEAGVRVDLVRKSPKVVMAAIRADTSDLRLLEGGLTEPGTIWEDLLRGLRKSWPDVAVELVSGRMTEQTLLYAVRRAAKPGVSEADRDLISLTADQWLRSRGTSGALVANAVELGENWDNFGYHSYSDGNAFVYCGSALDSLASRVGRNEWTDRAYLLLLDQGWVTDCSGQYEGADFGNDLFAPVLKRGESFLKSHPRSGLWSSVALRVALAHETLLSLAKTPDALRDWKTRAPQSRRRALDLYRQLVSRTQDAVFRQALERRIRSIERGVDTKCRVYYLEGEC